MIVGGDERPRSVLRETVTGGVDAAGGRRSDAIAVESEVPRPNLPLIAERLGVGMGTRWDVGRALAIGGMSTVFHLRHRLHGGQFVAKVLHPWMAESTELRRGFRDEAIHLALLAGHPNLPTILDFDEFDGLLYMVMSYVEGEDLDQLLARVGRLGRTEALMMCAQLASALSYAEARGVSHGDVSPGNIRLDTAGLYRLMDFGVSWRHADRSRREWRGATPAYASPEQLLGQEVDLRSDLWSLGAVLFEVLAGRPLFVATTLEDLRRQREAAIVWKLPEELRADRPLAALLESLLATDSAERIASPMLLLGALAAIGCQLPEQRERPATLLEPMPRAGQRSRLTESLVVSTPRTVGTPSLNVRSQQHLTPIEAWDFGQQSRNADSGSVDGEEFELLFIAAGP